MNAHQRRVETRRWERSIGARFCKRCLCMFQTPPKVCQHCGYDNSTNDQGRPRR